jgi:hypothetical protein
MFSLWMSALLPNRSTAAMAATGLTVASYFIDALGRVVKDIEGIRPLSLFYYYPGGDPLTKPFPVGDVALLLLIGLVCLIAAVWSLERRDVAVRKREWAIRWPRLSFRLGSTR